MYASLDSVYAVYIYAWLFTFARDYARLARPLALNTGARRDFSHRRLRVFTSNRKYIITEIEPEGLGGELPYAT